MISTTMVLTLRDSYKQEVFDFTCICDFHYWNDTVHAHVEINGIIELPIKTRLGHLSPTSVSKNIHSFDLFKDKSSKKEIKRTINVCRVLQC